MEAELQAQKPQLRTGQESVRKPKRASKKESKNAARLLAWCKQLWTWCEPLRAPEKHKPATKEAQQKSNLGTDSLHLKNVDTTKVTNSSEPVEVKGQDEGFQQQQWQSYITLAFLECLEREENTELPAATAVTSLCKFLKTSASQSFKNSLNSISTGPQCNTELKIEISGFDLSQVNQPSYEPTPTILLDQLNCQNIQAPPNWLFSQKANGQWRLVLALNPANLVYSSEKSSSGKFTKGNIGKNIFNKKINQPKKNSVGQSFIPNEKTTKPLYSASLDLGLSSISQQPKKSFNLKLQCFFSGQLSEAEIKDKETSLQGQIAWIDAWVKGLEQACQRHQQSVKLVQAACRRERNNYAAELHDSVAQTLAYLRLQSHRLKKTRELPDSSKHRQLCDDLDQHTQLAFKQVRQLISEARITLNEQNFNQALQAAVEDFSKRSDIVFELDNRLVNSLSHSADQQKLATQALHIVREAMSNIVRHSHAQHARIRVLEIKQSLLMDIDDDGIGLQQAAGRSDSYGLRIMQERAESVGGSFELRCPPEGGLHLQICLPLPKNE